MSKLKKIIILISAINLVVLVFAAFSLQSQLVNDDKVVEKKKSSIKIITPQIEEEFIAFPIKVEFKIPDTSKKLSVFLNEKEISNEFKETKDKTFKALLGDPEGLNIELRKKEMLEGNLLTIKMKKSFFRSEEETLRFFVVVDTYKKIGKEGGEIELIDLEKGVLGTKITVPKGALSEEKLFAISMKQYADGEIKKGTTSMGLGVDLSPEGLKPNIPIFLTHKTNEEYLGHISGFDTVFIKDNKAIELNYFDECEKEWKTSKIVKVSNEDKSITEEIKSFSSAEHCD